MLALTRTPAGRRFEFAQGLHPGLGRPVGRGHVGERVGARLTQPQVGRRAWRTEPSTLS